MKTLYLYILLLFNLVFYSSYAQGIYSIQGTVYDDQNESLPFASVILLQNDSIIQGVYTDVEGRYIIRNIEPGKYYIEVNFVGFNSFKKEIKFPLSKKQKEHLDISLDVSMDSGVILLKPIIYLYPEESTDITLTMDYDGELIHTYPRIESIWKVNASPNGTLEDTSGRSYYGLYWEGLPNRELQIDKGFCIKGEESIGFLETKLAELGLNEREANEFIIYWIPILEKNPYNLIHFSIDDYLDLAKMKVDPTPETIIRFMMVYQPMRTFYDIEPQDFSNLQTERKGFTLVEWGGTKTDQIKDL